MSVETVFTQDVEPHLNRAVAAIQASGLSPDDCVVVGMMVAAHGLGTAAGLLTAAQRLHGTPKADVAAQVADRVIEMLAEAELEGRL